MQVADERTLAFPSYDGNGMFLSLGNIFGNDKVGMLFIDFTTPHRLRVHGSASLHREPETLRAFPGADVIVQVVIEEVFVNCPRYIHHYERTHLSKYVPDANFTTPVVPQWKRIDAVQDALPARDGTIATTLGTLSYDQYGGLLRKGEA